MRVSNAPLYGPSAFTLTATSTMEFEAGGRAATGPATMPSASAPAATGAMRRRFTGVLLGRTVGSGVRGRGPAAIDGSPVSRRRDTGRLGVVPSSRCHRTWIAWRRSDAHGVDA